MKRTTNAALSWQRNEASNRAKNGAKVKREKGQHGPPEHTARASEDSEFKSPLKKGSKDAEHCRQSRGEKGKRDTSAAACASKEAKPKKPPKIYYTSRTHSQLAQVVEELRRSGFAPKMALLASREQYCINKKVRKNAQGINEACKRAIEAKSCGYFDNVSRLVGQAAKKTGAVDVEDLCEMGGRARGCPYYAAKALAQDADIVFCPYNYLVDPSVRKSLDIDIKGAVIILDEAHNIEDCARSAASVSLPLHYLQAASEEFSSAAETCESIRGSCHLLSSVLRSASELFGSDEVGNSLEQRGLSDFAASWEGERMLELLRSCGLDSDNACTLREAHKAIERQAIEAKPGEERVGTHARGVVEQLLVPLMYMHSEKECSSSFRLVLEESVYSERARRSLGLWCMDPWVAFRDLKPARSIVLTSGTLSPLATFPSELATEFRHQLQASHCIDLSSQVWAGVLGRGANGERLNGSFKYADCLEYQDGVADVLKAFCAEIPGGVLVFFPSHSLLDKLVRRWKETGSWDGIRKATNKKLMLEPKNQAHLDSLLGKYRQATTEAGGAILFAVCRGRVSEGMDFTNDGARGVVMVGVPYPNVKDLQVGLKRDHNDRAVSVKGKSGILSGSVWYSQQAFRALNQAVGRCIRHRSDVGAILLLDDRYADHSRELPRWLRPAVRTRSTLLEAVEALRKFFQQAQLEPSKEAVSSNTEVNWAEKIHPGPPSATKEKKPPAKRQRQEQQEEGTGIERIKAMFAAADKRRGSPLEALDTNSKGT